MMGVIPLLALSCAILVVELVQGRAPLVSASTINAFTGVFAYAALGALAHLNHTRTRRSSTVLLTFWPLWIIERVAALRTEVLIGNQREILFGLECAILGVGLILWALECFCPDRTKLDPDAEPEEKELPYERANVYSRLTYVPLIFISLLD